MGDLISPQWPTRPTRPEPKVIAMSKMQRVGNTLFRVMSPERARISGMTRAATWLMSWLDFTTTHVDHQFATEQLATALVSQLRHHAHETTDTSTLEALAKLQAVISSVPGLRLDAAR
jgi:hypothetical protein